MNAVDPRLIMTPKQVADLDAWIAKQLRNFGPGDMDAGIELMRGFRRARNLRAEQEARVAS